MFPPVVHQVDFFNKRETNRIKQQKFIVIQFKDDIKPIINILISI